MKNKKYNKGAKKALALAMYSNKTKYMSCSFGDIIVFINKAFRLGI